MKKSKSVSLAGIFTALCVVCLAIGAFIQTLDLTAAALGSIIILIVFIELGKKWAFGVYAAATVLSLLILPYKFPALVFGLFAGFYPIIKEPLNRIGKKWLSYTARIGVFNIALGLLAAVSYLFFRSEWDIRFEGMMLTVFIIGFWLTANVVFVFFDIALERLSVFYIVKIRPKVFGK